MTHVVVGAGEVGRAIAAVLPGDVYLRDVDGVTQRAETLHICFPWSPSFEREAARYIAECQPGVAVIHSTVPVGTSRRLGAVHSPVTGRHPSLEQSVRTFAKFFGGGRAALAAAPFMAQGVTCRLVPDPETTEAGKLLATLQHGWMVAIQKEAYRFCREQGADPAIAYREMNRAYNAGYAALGEPWALPVLRDVPGPIGGHCVIPNARMTPTRLAGWLLEMDGEW